MCLVSLENFEVEGNIAYKYFYTWNNQLYHGLYTGLMDGYYVNPDISTNKNRGPYQIGEWIEDTFIANIRNCRGNQDVIYKLGFHCYLDNNVKSPIFNEIDGSIKKSFPKYKVEFDNIVARGLDTSCNKVVVVRKMKILEKVE
jgi:hypothetical protein